jgi:hypothetical protein
MGPPFGTFSRRTRGSQTVSVFSVRETTDSRILLSPPVIDFHLPPVNFVQPVIDLHLSPMSFRQKMCESSRARSG